VLRQTKPLGPWITMRSVWPDECPGTWRHLWQRCISSACQRAVQLVVPDVIVVLVHSRWCLCHHGLDTYALPNTRASPVHPVSCRLYRYQRHRRVLIGTFSGFFAVRQLYPIGGRSRWCLLSSSLVQQLLRRP